MFLSHALKVVMLAGIKALLDTGWKAAYRIHKCRKDLRRAFLAILRTRSRARALFSGASASTTNMSRLALRLWAQQHITRAIGKSHVLLSSPTTAELVLCFDESGVACAICEAPGMRPTNSLSADEPWPTIQLHRRSDGGAIWVSWPLDAASPTEISSTAVKESLRQNRPALTEAGRRLVVSAIESYYLQHVLEPSVAGFLSILEKQFARSDLYLFELLQNAVDEGARSVKVELIRSQSGGLRFQHDGKGFSPLDVNGLASVGMSTKATKRAVGFMGIGFKACHKRFAHVVCSDKEWSFEFKEQQKGRGGATADGPALPPSGWVLLPRWSAQGKRPSVGCVFELMEPRGGLSALERDVRWLPPTVPPLLARNALSAASADSSGTPPVWELTWAGERLSCEVTKAAAAASSGPLLGNVSPSASVVRVTSTYTSSRPPSSAGATTNWQFLSIHYSPDEAAWRAYATHTRRDPQALIAERPTEEISLFFRTSGETGLPLPPSRAAPQSGKGGGKGGGGKAAAAPDPYSLHALLPTKLILPFSAHLQGPWLLSVDRQDVQSLQDSAWNASIAKQLPALFVCALRHIAEAVRKASGGSWLLSEGSLAGAYALLPSTMERAAAGREQQWRAPPSSSATATAIKPLSAWSRSGFISTRPCPLYRGPYTGPRAAITTASHHSRLSRPTTTTILPLPSNSSSLLRPP